MELGARARRRFEAGCQKRDVTGFDWSSSRTRRRLRGHAVTGEPFIWCHAHDIVTFAIVTWDYFWLRCSLVISLLDARRKSIHWWHCDMNSLSEPPALAGGSCFIAIECNGPPAYAGGSDKSAAL